MTRDFSDHAKQELLRLVRETEEEKLCDFTDWVGDRWYDFEEWIGVLRLKDDLSNVNAYHKKVIDKNNATIADIERIFSEVHGVEERYHHTLQGIIDSSRALNNLLIQLSDIIAPGGLPMTTECIHLALRKPFQEYSELFAQYIDWQQQLEILLEKIKAKGTLTTDDMDEVIHLYETYHPKIKLKIEKLLDKLSEKEIRKIKYYIYSSEEPYRSIYLEQLEGYHLGNISGKDTGYFSPSDNSVNVDMPNEPKNPRGPYTTFFHECGHAIDYNYNDDGNYFSVTYRNENGQSLMDMIYADVRNNVTQTINRYTSDPTMQQHLLDYIMGAKSVSEDSLTNTERALLRQIQSQYKNDMAGALNEAASDVYGGVTSNIISGSYGHWDDSYWYQNGNPTNAQCMELWAEYYSYCMTGNETSMASLREYFPQASAYLDEMAASMR